MQFSERERCHLLNTVGFYGHPGLGLVCHSSSYLHLIDHHIVVGSGVLQSPRLSVWDDSSILFKELLFVTQANINSTAETQLYVTVLRMKMILNRVRWQNSLISFTISPF